MSIQRVSLKLENLRVSHAGRVAQRAGKALPLEDRQVYLDALLCLCAVWHDMSSSRFSLARLLNTMFQFDVEELVSFLKTADTLLLEVSSSSDFKGRLKRSHPGTWGLLAPLWGDIAEWFRNYEPTTFFRLHQCFVFLSRLTLSGSDDLTEKSQRDFMENEDRLRTLTSMPNLGNTIERWFPKDAMKDIFRAYTPNHGGGATAECSRSEGFGPRAKTALVHPDLTLKWWLKTIDATVWSTSIVEGSDTPVTSRTARFVCVPKGIDKLRGICMEPSTLMFFQQGVMKAIISYIERRNSDGSFAHPLGKRISLSHQEYNRDAARTGSISSALVTVDLSSASDSVSLALVKQWFRHSALYSALIATSSRFTDISGDVYKNVRFAPMGSAVCFPVECVVFACICEKAIRDAGGDPDKSLYRVYGDDIIIENEYFSYLEKVLTDCGFILNNDKSFVSTTGPIFRESCGAEYMDGIDVHAYRVSRGFKGFKLHSSAPGVIENLIAMANDTLGVLPTLHRFVISYLNRVQPAPIRSFSTAGIHSFEPSNYGLKRKWDRNIQQRILLHGGVVEQRPHVEMDETAYYHWLYTTRDRDPRKEFPYLWGVLHPEQTCVDYNTPIKRRWSLVKTIEE